jgi:hypothetical protein
MPPVIKRNVRACRAVAVSVSSCGTLSLERGIASAQFCNGQVLVGLLSKSPPSTAPRPIRMRASFTLTAPLFNSDEIACPSSLP